MMERSSEDDGEAGGDLMMTKFFNKVVLVLVAI